MLLLVAVLGGGVVYPGFAATSATAPPKKIAWAKVVAAAKKQGTVTLYSQVTFCEACIAGLQTAFNKTYPTIKLNYVRLDTSTAEAKIEAERSTGAEGGDLYINGNVIFAKKQIAQAGNRIPVLTGPNIAKLDKGDVKLKGRIATIGMQVVGFGYNTKTTGNNPPRTWENLLESKYKGRIGIPDFTAPAYAHFYAMLDKQAGGDFMKKLAAQKPVVFAGITPALQGVISGEVDVNIFAPAPLYKAQTAAGAPVGFVIPRPAWASQLFVQVLGWAKHKQAAQLLADFIMRPTAQQYLNQDSISPLNTTVPGTLEGVTKKDLVVFNGDLSAAEFLATFNFWKQTFGR